MSTIYAVFNPFTFGVYSVSCVWPGLTVPHTSILETAGCIITELLICWIGHVTSLPANHCSRQLRYKERVCGHWNMVARKILRSRAPHSQIVQYTGQRLDQTSWRQLCIVGAPKHWKPSDNVIRNDRTFRTLAYPSFALSVWHTVRVLSACAILYMPMFHQLLVTETAVEILK